MRLEPMTLRLRVARSTYWDTRRPAELFFSNLLSSSSAVREAVRLHRWVYPILSEAAQWSTGGMHQFARPVPFHGHFGAFK